MEQRDGIGFNAGLAQYWITLLSHSAEESRAHGLLRGRLLRQTAGPGKA
jgi:hypothetical protein